MHKKIILNFQAWWKHAVRFSNICNYKMYRYLSMSCLVRNYCKNEKFRLQLSVCTSAPLLRVKNMQLGHILNL